MPELPEVETVCRGLAPAMEGALIVGVDLRRAGLRFAFPPDFAARLTGRRVVCLSRRAKYILADLDDATVLTAHLGMSGSFRVEQQQADSMHGAFHRAGSSAKAHDHVVLYLENAGKTAVITYNDPRRFGYMDLIERKSLANHRHFARLGIEPLGNELDGAAIAALFAGKHAPLKTALLDQSLIAGLGNIYACEALWLAGLAPARAAGSIVRKPAQCEKLAAAIRDVLARAVTAGGSSLRDHRRTDGSLAGFQNSFCVYDREGESCMKPGCRGMIVRLVQSGRSTFHCRSCQR